MRADASEMLNGAYDEAESAESFQQALMAWRSGNKDGDDTTEKQMDSTKVVKSQSGAVLKKAKRLQLSQKLHINKILFLFESGHNVMNGLKTFLLAFADTAFDFAIPWQCIVGPKCFSRKIR